MNTEISSAAVEMAEARQFEEGCLNPVIEQYFKTLNAGEFQATAALFAEDGMLQPPFEDAIVGRKAIATYLQAEARDLQLVPMRRCDRPLETGNTEFDIRGHVQTPLLRVNVAWRLILKSEQQLVVAQVRLLATLAELLPFRQ